jgi:hypothetical protein
LSAQKSALCFITICDIQGEGHEPSPTVSDSDTGLKALPEGIECLLTPKLSLIILAACALNVKVYHTDIKVIKIVQQAVHCSDSASDSRDMQRRFEGLGV